METEESRRGPCGALGGPASCCALGFQHPKVVDFCFLLSSWSRLLIIPVLVLVASRLGASLWLWGQVGALLRGSGYQGQGSKGALTLELRSWVCLGGRCGCSICSLWTGPGRAVPRKPMARLER